jgi:adenylylsulfate kinase-like enzyme
LVIKNKLEIAVVYWITGRKNSGKTTLAYRLKAQIPDSVVLDGDEFREYFPAGFEYGAREKNVMRIAKVAAILEKQGTTVIIACVSPYKVLREEAQALFKECIEICMPFGELWEGTEFEEPEHGRET